MRRVQIFHPLLLVSLSCIVCKNNERLTMGILKEVLTAVGLLQVIKSLKKEANKNGKMGDQNNEKMTCKCQAIRYHTLEIMK